MKSLHTGRVLSGAVALAMIALPWSARADDAQSGNCKVVHLKPGEHAPGQITSSVTAGGGQVSAQTTGGNSVTVHSGDGRASSAVTTGTSSNGQSTTVTSANGDCTIYVNPGEKK